MQLQPRAVFTPALAEADRQRILDLYAKARPLRRRGRAADHPAGRRTASTWCSRSPTGRSTLISRIAFVGNHAFSESRLREVIDSREAGLVAVPVHLRRTTIPSGCNYDKELLRRFYLKNGYADFEVTSAIAELAPDRSAFFLTFTLNEGERYRVGKVIVNSQLRNLDQRSRCSRDCEMSTGRLVRRRRGRAHRAGDDRRCAEPRLCRSST